MKTNLTLKMGVGAAAVAFLSAAQAAPIMIHLSGDTSPSVTNLSHVYVLAWFQESGVSDQHEAVGGWSVSDAARSVVNELDLKTSIEQDAFNDPIGFAKYTVIGVYEDGGVSVSMLDSAFIPGFSDWSSIFATSESTVQGWLESGDTSSLNNWFHNEMVTPGFAPSMGVRASQVDFSIADVNGSSFVDFAVIPAPGVAGMLGIGGVLVTRRRR